MFTTSNQQIYSVFGSGYVSEHHVEARQRYLPASENESMFDEILTTLRSALSRCDRKDQ